MKTWGRLWAKNKGRKHEEISVLATDRIISLGELLLLLLLSLLLLSDLTNAPSPRIKRVLCDERFNGKVSLKWVFRLLSFSPDLFIFSFNREMENLRREWKQEITSQQNWHCFRFCYSSLVLKRYRRSFLASGITGQLPYKVGV